MSSETTLQKLAYLLLEPFKARGQRKAQLTEDKHGRLYYSGDPVTFHDWEFRVKAKRNLHKARQKHFDADKRTEFSAWSVVNDLTGVAMQAATDLGEETLNDPEPVWTSSSRKSA